MMVTSALNTITATVEFALDINTKNAMEINAIAQEHVILSLEIALPWCHIRMEPIALILMPALKLIIALLDNVSDTIQLFALHMLNAMMLVFVIPPLENAINPILSMELLAVTTTTALK
jgi:hypothetical protein